MRRARFGWRTYAVLTGGWGALGIYSLIIGSTWLSIAQLALAAVQLSIAIRTYRKASRMTSPRMLSWEQRDTVDQPPGR